MKTCTKCGIGKPETAFHSGGKMPGTKRAVCKDCDRAARAKRCRANDVARLAENERARARYAADAEWAANRRRAAYVSRRIRAGSDPHFLDKRREATLAIACKRFGITVADYWRMFGEQRGGCAICGEPEGRRRFAIDHDHATGAVRALLCSACNTAIGHLRDDPKLCTKAAEYLARAR